MRQIATGAIRKSNETVIDSAIAVKGPIGISPSVFNAKKVKPGQDSSDSRLNTAKKSLTHSPSLAFFSDTVYTGYRGQLVPNWTRMEERGLHRNMIDTAVGAVCGREFSMIQPKTGGHRPPLQ